MFLQVLGAEPSLSCTVDFPGGRETDERTVREPGLSLFGIEAPGAPVPRPLSPTRVKSGSMRHNASAVQLLFRFHDIQTPN